MKHRVFVLMLGVLAGLTLSQPGCGPVEKPEDVTEPEPVYVTVAPIDRRQVERTVDAVGSLRGWEQVTVGAKKSGRVLKVHHDMGDRVRPDEPLLQIDPVDAELAQSAAETRYLAELVKLGITSKVADDFIHRYGISEALVTGSQTEELIEKIPTVVQTRVAMEKASQNLNRQRNLNRKGAGTTQELEDQESEYRSMAAAYDQSKVAARNVIALALANRVARDQADQVLKDLTILTPRPQAPPPTLSDAVDVVYAISERSVSEGQMIREGDAVFSLVIENPVRLWANIPERYADQIHLQQPVRISVASHPGRIFEGEVSRINPTVDSVSRTFQVEAMAVNDELLLRPGGFAKAVIVTESQSDAVVVPIEAVVQYAGVTKLFVVDGDVVRAVDDLVLGKQDAGWVVVENSSMPASGFVVTTGHSRLADGSKIVIREPEDDESSDDAPESPAKSPRDEAEAEKSLISSS